MIVSKQFKNLAKKAASKDGTRYNLQCVYADKNAGALVATNGHIMVSVAADEIERDALISVDAYNRAHQLCSRSDDHAYIELLDGGTAMRDGAVFPDQPGEFPNWRQIQAADRSGKVPVTFNAQLLHDISKALGQGKTDGVTLWVDPDNTHKPIRVEIYAEHCDEMNERTFGVLMPMRNNRNRDK